MLKKDNQYLKNLFQNFYKFFKLFIRNFKYRMKNKTKKIHTMDIRKSKRWHEGIKMMDFTFYKVSKVLLLLFWSYWSKFTRRLCDMLLALNKTK